MVLDDSYRAIRDLLEAQPVGFRVTTEKGIWEKHEDGLWYRVEQKPMSSTLLATMNPTPWVPQDREE